MPAYPRHGGRGHGGRTGHQQARKSRVQQGRREGYIGVLSGMGWKRLGAGALTGPVTIYDTNL